MLTLLVQNDDVATGEVDGMRSAEAGHYVAEKGQPESECARMPEGISSNAVMDGKAWEYLRPPPTTITLGAIVADVVVRRGGIVKTWCKERKGICSLKEREMEKGKFVGLER